MAVGALSEADPIMKLFLVLCTEQLKHIERSVFDCINWNLGLVDRTRSATIKVLNRKTVIRRSDEFRRPEPRQMRLVVRPST